MRRSGLFKSLRSCRGVPGRLTKICPRKRWPGRPRPEIPGTEPHAPLSAQRTAPLQKALRKSAHPAEAHRPPSWNSSAYEALFEHVVYTKARGGRQEPTKQACWVTIDATCTSNKNTRTTHENGQHSSHRMAFSQGILQIMAWLVLVILGYGTGSVLALRCSIKYSMSTCML